MGKQLARVAAGKTKWQMVISEDLHDALKEQAAAEGRTVTAIMTELAEKYIAKRRLWHTRP